MNSTREISQEIKKTRCIWFNFHQSGYLGERKLRSCYHSLSSGLGIEDNLIFGTFSADI